MCRMIAAPLGIPGDLLIDPFLRLAQGLNTLSELNPSMGRYTHGHGWGAVIGAGCEDKVLRRVNACWDDRSLDALRDETVFLLHARMASRGAVNSENVHPFQVLVNGCRWSLCHNGTVRDALKPPTTLRTPDCTDSEMVLHQLLPYLERNQVLEGIRTIYAEIADFTSLNTFLLGPEALWVVCLYTEMPTYYTLHLSATMHGPVVSSEPLSDLSMQPVALSNGQILCVDRSSGDINEYEL